MRARKEEYSQDMQPLLAGSDAPYRQIGSEFVTLRDEEGLLLAVGMTWKNSVHPMHRYLYISVHPHQRRRGLATAVYCALQMLYPDEKWQAMIDSYNDAAAQWLESMGFRCVRRCYTVEVSCMDIKEDVQQEVLLTPFRDLSVEQMTYLLTMLRADYAAKHESVSPLNAEYDEAVFGAYAMEGIDLKESFCLLENGQIAAYVCCYDGDERYLREVGYLGQRIEERERYRQFLLNFVHRSFCTAGGLLIEADDCDQDAMELLSLFQTLPEYSCDTYIA